METKNETGLSLLQKEQPTLAQLVLVNMPPNTSLEEAQRVALKEVSNFEMMLQTKPDLKACNPKSVLLAVKQCICDGLTLAPSAGLVYLLPSRVKVGQNGNQDIYEWVVQYDPTANGRLSIAFQSGAILDVKRPYFEFNENEQLTKVTVEFLVPSYGQPRWEVISFGEMHFKKWMAASAKKNKGSANPNYTSWNGGIDPEFAATKAIRHGLGKRGINLNGKRFQVPVEKTNIIPVEVAENEAREEILMDDYVKTQNGKVEVSEAVIISETNTLNDLPI